MLISLGRAASDAHPVRTETTWPQLVQWLYQHQRSDATITADEYQRLKSFPSKSPEGQRLHAEKDSPYIVLADFGGGRRSLEATLASYGVPLDFDSGQVTYQTIVDTLKGYTYVAYSTYAHMAGGVERWRVFVPVARGMTAAEHYATWEQLSNAFPGGADPAAKDPSRLSYVPGRCLYPDNAQTFHADGALFQPATPVTDSTPALQLQNDGPVPGWNGPTDDETLLAIASTLRMRPDERMGMPIHFAMLWTANEAWLGAHFPASANEQGQSYSRTKADMALAGELAYFTGSDRARMLRLLLASGLRREDADWQERKTLRAIDHAIGNAKQWHFMGREVADMSAPVADTNIGQMVVSIGEVAPPPPAMAGNMADIPSPTNSPTIPPVPTSAMDALIANATGAGAAPGLNDYWGYKPNAQYIHRATGDLHSASSLDQILGKDLRMTIMAARNVDRMTWAPGRPERFQQHEIDAACDPARPIWLYNKYRAPRPATKEGNVKAWLDLLNSRYPEDADHIVNYFADAVQSAERKCNHALVLGSGVHGIGKDTLLHPLSHAVGSWNYRVIKPADLGTAYNPWVASRVLLVSESRDMGDGMHSISRFDMYEKCKELCAAPPDTIEVNDKYINQHPVLNVVRLILTTNHRTDGLHIPPEDRRHYCAWSDADKLDEDDAAEIWEWYAAGGLDFVAHYLTHLDLSQRDWNPKAPPRKTAWWHQLAEGARTAEDERFTDAIEKLGKPDWVTLGQVAGAGGLELTAWISAPGNRRKVEREMDRAGYRRLPNPAESRGRWMLENQRVVVYRRSNVPEKVLLAKFGVV